MKSSKVPPVLDLKSVLINHIRAKLKQFVPLSHIVDDLAEELYEAHSNKEVISLLENDCNLRNSVLNRQKDGPTKQKLGTELFVNISHLDTPVCAQLTGMLLDLDIITICHLLCNSDALESAVFKAKEEYLRFKQASCKDLFGEKIYCKVISHHPEPELAAKLTGMLLELETSELQRMLDNSEEFTNKLNLALAAIQ